MAFNHPSGFLDLTVWSAQWKQVQPLPDTAFLPLHVMCDHLYLCKHGTIFYGTTYSALINTDNSCYMHRAGEISGYLSFYSKVG